MSPAAFFISETKKQPDFSGCMVHRIYFLAAALLS